LNKLAFLIFFTAALPYFAQEGLSLQNAASFQETLNSFPERDRWNVRRFIGQGNHEKELPLEQLLEMNDNEKTALKMFLAMEETEKETIKFLFENERKYFSARNKFAVFSAISGATAVFIPPLALLTAVGIGRENIYFFLSGFTGTIFCGTLFTVSIPFTIVNATRMHKYKKYKPSMSVSSSEVRFSVNF
jgi:hypothetical protein